MLEFRETDEPSFPPISANPADFRQPRRFPPTPPISANPADFRHSRESGNPETPNAAGIYRKRLKPDGPDSRLRGN
ncbi:hypothetical protein E5O57_002228, partial [Neisseria gonorrhoeae]